MRYSEKEHQFYRQSLLSFIGQNPYSDMNNTLMKVVQTRNLEEIWRIMTKLECPHVQTDRRWPFVQPSWLSFIGQYPKLILGKSLMKLVHICNLEDIG